MEPFQDSKHIDKYKRRLGMRWWFLTCNGKIWFFVNDGIEVEVLMNPDQQVTLKLTFLDSGKMFVTILVYAKCDAVDRLELWDNIYSLSSSMNFPWLVGGDFNVILHEEEKIGGLPVHQTEVEDFAFFKNSCDLQDIDFRGSPFTWWNGRAGEDFIFKILDRILVNNQLQEWLGNLQMEHLSRTGSDRAPLLLTAGEQVQQFSKPFRFLKFWVDHESFMHTVEQHWSTEFVEGAFITFKLKMKKLKAALSVWSKETFGDIFKQLTIREDIVKIKEQLFEEDPSEVNRMVLQQTQAEFKRYMHFKEEFWKQKAGVKWQSEGDRNTRFFHSLQQFSSEATSSDYNILEHVEEAVTQDPNDLLCSMPSLEEVHKAVFELAGDSACGPDGLSGIFYQKCWDIVGADVYNVVKAFFNGQTLPKSVTHTNLVLLRKKEIINNFSDLRPISLSNFINKIITRVIHDRLESILPSLISQKQSGFVKGRNIIENVLLTQKVVADIRKRGRLENVIIQLDMAKAYDRATSFFHSTRGVKQDDPLSPALFILAAEVLSRALNSLFDEGMYRGYGLAKWSSNLNHLSYADDIIIFASADKWSLQRIMKILHEYEAVSGQKINVHKSAFCMYKRISSELVNEVQQSTGFSRGEFPFTYLGCPVFHARKQKIFYRDVIKKVRDKLQAWKGKLLSFGAMVPPKSVIKELQNMFNRFFWQTKTDGKCKHWSEWNKLCYPKGEGGLGFRSLNDISKALFSKLCWRFRISNSLWSNFMWNKYCKKVRPTLVQWKGSTQTWKYMLEASNDIEHHIWWEPHQGSISIWYDNWLKIGALNDQIQFQAYKDDSVEDLAEIMEGDHWDMTKVQQMFCDEMEIDKPHWMLTSSGKFTVSSAWEYIRQKRQVKHAILKWWNTPVKSNLKTLYQAVPTFILSHLWKGRNTRRHGGSITVNKVIYEINRGILLLAQSLFPGMKLFPKRWPFFVQYLENSEKDKVVHKEVTWSKFKKFSRIRDHNGDLVYAAGKRLEDTTNVIAEVVAIENGIQYCVDHHQLLPLIVETDSLTMQKMEYGKYHGGYHWYHATDIGLTWSLKAGSVLLQWLQEVLPRRCITTQRAIILMDQYAGGFSSLCRPVLICELGHMVKLCKSYKNSTGRSLLQPKA
ncbi:uncharacterized protein LOC132057787 [Lycium ferocissimum]|uniref:uncharacterized protein LOC132057787 n=1 Tax=Lycium ferocissimum TaxID=112874 RepID=UPI002816908B|nr:uncharacterized protein LOC132057787 [Lycium ferocissimum]